MTDAALSHALDRCLFAIRRGESFEAVLRHHQALRPELDSLLLAALQLPHDPASEFSLSSKTVVRAGLMNAIRSEPHEPPARSAWALPLPWLPWRKALIPALAATTVAVVLFGMTITSGPEQAVSYSTATVLTVLEGEVEVETARGMVPGANGMVIEVGDRVLTRAGARAVLTFFDGSTVVLDADSIVLVRQVTDTNGKLQASLAQEQGSTWTYIPQALSPADVEIHTPSARVETSQASVETTVRTDGSTNVGAQNGAVAVQTSASTTTIPSGFSASVPPPTVTSTGPVTAAYTPPPAVQPAPSVQAARELVLRVEGKVYAALTDPRQATLGTIAPGVPVNQIAGAWSERDGEAVLLHVPNAADGQYRLSISANAVSRVVVSVIVRGGANDRFETALAMAAGEGATLSFSVGQEDVTLLGTTKTAQPAASSVVVPGLAANRATVVNTLSSTTVTGGAGGNNAGTGGVITTGPFPAFAPLPTSTPRPAPTPTPLPSPTPVPTKAPSTSPVDSNNLSPSISTTNRLP